MSQALGYIIGVILAGSLTAIAAIIIFKIDEKQRRKRIKMNKDDILIVRCNRVLTTADSKKFYNDLVNMKEKGVVLLPGFCDVVVAPKDIEIKVENDESC